MQKTKYSSYGEYVSAQEARSHNKDDERGRFLYKQCLHILKTTMGIKPKKIFDIGCRDACWFDDFEKDGIECRGIDISQKSIDYALGKGRKVECVDIDEAIIPDGVDCVIMSHSIEHLLHPELTLEKIYEETDKNAVVIIKCPVQAQGLRKGEKAHAWAWNLKEITDMLSQKWTIGHYVPLRGEWFFILHKYSKQESINPLNVKNDWLQPTEHIEEISKLLTNEWLRKKVDRLTRMKDKQWYIDKYLPEIKKGENYILDLGCGPPEFLEYCRYYFNIGVGIDVEDSPMQNDYGKYSMLMNKAQMIDVKYTDFRKIFESKDYSLGKFNIINSQGSINQILKDDIKWQSLHEGEWVLNKCPTTFALLFDWLRRSLYRNGIVVIYSNSMKNDSHYNRIINKAAEKCGFKLILQDKTLHKWRRIDR